jgi:hypothetical protein
VAHPPARDASVTIRMTTISLTLPRAA